MILGVYVVVTGLPAAGKTTVARPLADALDVVLIEKDAIKEALFETEGYGGWERSKELSLAADEAMISAARDVPSAVLDNFWRPETVSMMLAPLSGRLVELCCRCPAEIAFERFKRRDRHPGHADDQNATNLATFEGYAARLPLGLGPVVEVDTSRAVHGDSVVEGVMAAAQR